MEGGPQAAEARALIPLPGRGMLIQTGGTRFSAELTLDLQHDAGLSISLF